MIELIDQNRNLTFSTSRAYGCKFMRRSRSAKRGSERSGSKTGSTLIVPIPTPSERSS
jgi:hypothetical protein